MQIHILIYNVIFVSFRDLNDSFLLSETCWEMLSIFLFCAVDFDHSGKYLATGGEHISIYEIDAGCYPITTFSDLPAKGDVSCVKFGKDAKYVAAAAGTSDSKLLLFGL